MTRFDFSPSFRTMLDFALLLGLTDGVGIVAMTASAKSQCLNIQLLVGMEIAEAAEARTHSEPEIRRIWWAVRSRCKAMSRQGAGIDQFREDSRLGELWREARIEAL